MTNENIKFFEHIVLPSDTLQGLSLFYGISIRKLKQFNGFSGESLSMAPNKMKIPINISCNLIDSCHNDKCADRMKSQDESTKEFKISALRVEVYNRERNLCLSAREATNCLEKCKWNLKSAISFALDKMECPQKESSPLGESVPYWYFLAVKSCKEKKNHRIRNDVLTAATACGSVDNVLTGSTFEMKSEQQNKIVGHKPEKGRDLSSTCFEDDIFSKAFKLLLKAIIHDEFHSSIFCKFFNVRINCKDTVGKVNIEMQNFDARSICSKKNS